MSKILFAVHREYCNYETTLGRIEEILREIAPDIIRDSSRYSVAHEDGRFLGTLNLEDGCRRYGVDVCQGRLNQTTDWWRLGSGVPDGCYGLVRSDIDAAETFVDPGGMRSLWFYFDADMFVVSNSQRAVTMYIGRFDFNRDVAPWLISTGSLGPDRSYNRHLRLLPPGAIARLTRADWALTVQEPRTIRFTSDSRPDEEHIEAAEAAISETLASLGQADVETTALSLSGGCDSRLIANLLRRAHSEVAWKSFSGGPGGSERIPGSDPAVAAEVARVLGFRHRFFANDASDARMETCLRRFLLCSEGRIDHFEGYADGMRIFKALFDEGVAQVIRGDQTLGGPAIEQTETSALRSIKLFLCRDIAGISERLAEFDLDDQTLPERFHRRPDEGFVSWRDRLYLQYRGPSVLAALNETKTGFFDLREPLLSARVRTMALSLPDSLRNGKEIGRILLRRTGPDLPPVKIDGDSKMKDLLRHPVVARAARDSLASGTARTCFSPALLGWIEREVAHTDGPLAKATRALSARLAPRFGHMGDDRIKVGPRRLAFRVHMAVTMVEQLSADAARFASGRDARDPTGSPAHEPMPAMA